MCFPKCKICWAVESGNEAIYTYTIILAMRLIGVLQLPPAVGELLGVVLELFDGTHHGIIQGSLVVGIHLVQALLSGEEGTTN